MCHLLVSHVGGSCRRGVQIPGARSPGQLNFLWWCLIFVDPYTWSFEVGPGFGKLGASVIYSVFQNMSMASTFVVKPQKLKLHILKYLHSEGIFVK
jgi:hypothetical protein